MAVANNDSAKSRAMMLGRRNKISEVRRVIDVPPFRFSIRTNWITITTIDTFLTRETLQRWQCLFAGHEPGCIAPLISNSLIGWKVCPTGFRGIALNSGTRLG